jgi:polysaccharide export outer membrane protein
VISNDAYHQGVRHPSAAFRALLLAATASVALLAAAPPAPAHDYILHSGDQVAISVFGDQTLSASVVILSDGSVVYPLIGKIKLGGYTISAATSRVANALRKYVRDPMVTLDVTQQGTDSVLVLGNVKTPGKYSLASTARIADAIAAAGGIAYTNGDYPDARISVDGGPAQTVSLQSLMRDGKLDDNVSLGSDTIVYIAGPTPLSVEVLGSVDHPGAVPIYVGDRLSIAIAKAGNTSSSHADLSHVHVSHTGTDGTTQTQTFDLYRALEHGDLTADPVLQKNDVVFVPEAHQNDHVSSVFQGIFAVLSRLVFPF